VKLQRKAPTGHSTKQFAPMRGEEEEIGKSTRSSIGSKGMCFS
jgi:hypothetical protein